MGLPPGTSEIRSRTSFWANIFFIASPFRPWAPLGPPNALPGTLRDLPKIAKVEEQNCQYDTGFILKIEALTSSCKSRTPQKAPNGPDPLARGLPGRPQGRLPPFSDPTWTSRDPIWIQPQKQYQKQYNLLKHAVFNVLTPFLRVGRPWSLL